MVTKLVIDNNSNVNKGLNVYEQFEEETGIDLVDHCLIKLSKCKKYTHVYTDLSHKNIGIFVNILLDNDYAVYSKKDYTKRLMNIFKNGEIFSFKVKFKEEPDFNSKVVSFILKTIPKTSTRLTVKSLLENIFLERSSKNFFSKEKPTQGWLNNISLN